MLESGTEAEIVAWLITEYGPGVFVSAPAGMQPGQLREFAATVIALSDSSGLSTIDRRVRPAVRNLLQSGSIEDIVGLLNAEYGVQISLRELGVDADDHAERDRDLNPSAARQFVETFARCLEALPWLDLRAIGIRNLGASIDDLGADIAEVVPDDENGRIFTRLITLDRRVFADPARQQDFSEQVARGQRRGSTADQIVADAVRHAIGRAVVNAGQRRAVDPAAVTQTAHRRGRHRWPDLRRW